VHQAASEGVPLAEPAGRPVTRCWAYKCTRFWVSVYGGDHLCDVPPAGEPRYRGLLARGGGAGPPGDDERRAVLLRMGQTLERPGR
jgi:hypothetical protein